MPKFKTTIAFLVLTIVCTCSCLPGTQLVAHEGPDPVSHWLFNSRTVDESGNVEARIGPNAAIEGDFRLITSRDDNSVELNGAKSQILISEDISSVRRWLPEKDFTISAWVSIDQRRSWGSIIGLMQDNRDAETGFVLGYNNENFYFGLATSEADDGDGNMTYLTGSTAYELGKYYQVVASYDGETMRLFVNGELDAQSDEQGGAILYPEEAPYTIGCYRDDDEFFPHAGRIRDVAVYELAAKPKWIEQEFARQESITRLDARNADSQQPLEFAVRPYLQYVTTDSITVMSQTSDVANATVQYGENADCDSQAGPSDGKLIHEVKINNLKPNTQYFYRVSAENSHGESTISDVRTFQTAPDSDTAYAFAVISDTQSNPKVAKQIAELAWAERPSFVVHPGDLVGTGTNDSHWTQEFFPAMESLISRVPFFPVLVNHEVNADNYFDYVSLPNPEYYYEFQYGNAHFFMIDSNRKVGKGSEQFDWLDEALGKSTAQWKFVVHHHPAYSSDENDYGDLWKTNRSTQGDLRVRDLCKLYDKHSVNIVFNGHIHSYERTWPVKDAQANNDGTIYMITGGGGGSLETPGPKRTFFSHSVRRGHHFCMVHINGKEVQLKAFNLDGQLFDTLKLSQ